MKSELLVIADQDVYKRQELIHGIPDKKHLIKEGDIVSIDVGACICLLYTSEIEYDKIDKVRGMDITFVTTAKTDEEAKELLTLMGAPFEKRCV